MFEKPDYRERARAFQKIIRDTGGAEAAAGIIETAARTARAVEAAVYQ
jgi:UDP:flavonoid glycosyltransferase YjiC (YdhE family)